MNAKKKTMKFTKVLSNTSIRKMFTALVAVDDAMSLIEDARSELQCAESDVFNTTDLDSMTCAQVDALDELEQALMDASLRFDAIADAFDNNGDSPVMFTLTGAGSDAVSDVARKQGALLALSAKKKKATKKKATRKTRR